MLLVWFDWVAVHLIPLPWRGGRRKPDGVVRPLAQTAFASPPPPPACGVPLHGRGIRNGGVCKEAAKRKALNLQHKPKPKSVFGIFLRLLRNLCALCVLPRIQHGAQPQRKAFTPTPNPFLVFSLRTLRNLCALCVRLPYPRIPATCLLPPPRRGFCGCSPAAFWLCQQPVAKPYRGTAPQFPHAARQPL